MRNSHAEHGRFSDNFASCECVSRGAFLFHRDAVSYEIKSRIRNKYLNSSLIRLIISSE